MSTFQPSRPGRELRPHRKLKEIPLSKLPLVALFAATLLASAPSFAEECSTAARCDEQCSKGATASCVKAGEIYEAGKGVPADPNRALFAYRHACDVKDAQGCAHAARMLFAGSGVAPDMNGAQVFWNRACDLKDNQSCRALAQLHETGGFGAVDIGRASAEYYKGCELFDAQSCALLGRLYLWGSGLPADPARAASYFSLACDRGHGPSCIVLSEMHERGEGVAKDPARARQLQQKGTKLMEAKDAPKALAPPPVFGNAAVLAVSSEPADALLSIDGFVLGPGPLNARAPAGAHVISARRKNGSETSQLVQVQATGSQKVVLTFSSSLKVTSSPAGAAVTIDEKPAGVTPLTVPLSAGPHKLSLHLEGYVDEQRTTTVESGGETALAVPLSPKDGELKVESTPAGASLFANGKLLGVTPFVGTLKPGIYAVLLKLAGFKPAGEKVTLLRGQSVEKSYTLQAIEVPCVIESTPKVARVRIDSADVGVTPYRGKITVGPHTVELALEGYQGVSEAIVVAPADKAFKKGWTLTPSPASLSVTSEPAGADVLVDGAKVGTTPYTGAIPLGLHRLSVSLGGYEPIEDAVTAYIGQPLSKKYSLTARYVDVSIATEPPGAAVSVDGQVRGPSPYKTSLLPGKHPIEITLEGYQPVTKEAVVLPGVPLNLSLTLEKIAPVVVGKPPEITPPVEQVKPPPPPDPKVLAEQENAILSNPAAQAGQKRQTFLAALQRRGPDSAPELLQKVQPEALRSAMCMDKDLGQPTAQLTVNAVDAFEDDVPSAVTLNGVELGNTPLSAKVPACATKLEVKGPKDDQHEARDVALQAGKITVQTVKYGGRPRIGLISLMGEYAQADRDWDTFKVGMVGVSNDYFGHLLHFHIAVKGAYLSQRGTANLVQFPLADVMFGIGTVLAPSDAFRFHVGASLGAWSLVYPSGRLMVGIQLGDAVSLSVHGGVHLAYQGLQNPSTDYVFYSAGLSLGVVTHGF